MLCSSLRTVSNSSSLSLICFCIALWGGRLWKLTLDPDDFKACHADESDGRGFLGVHFSASATKNPLAWRCLGK